MLKKNLPWTEENRNVGDVSTFYTQDDTVSFVSF